MRVLFAVILACNIYFSYMIYEILKFPKYSTVKTVAVNVPKNYIIISINGVANGSESYKERNPYSGIYVQLCHRSDQRFMANRFAKVKTNKKSTSQRYCKSAREDSRLHFRMNASRIYRRKLLGHEQIFRDRPTRLRKSHRMHREIKAAKKSESKEKRHIAKTTELSYDEDADSEAWDNWNNWSACSVTCGPGRQVRWRHCTLERCVKGLKKVQLKSCHLKDCNSKGFLGWLGIKT